MEKLTYITRPGTSPQGLPKVYYTCQGQEPEGCFEEIADDILSLANCAVYRYEGEPDQDDAYFQTLSQMNLVVIPVTDSLLNCKNRAMDVDFPYAVNRNIPVLPLLQQSGLEQQFNQRFGDRQYLYKHDPDATALPFKEKLKKYLDAVLVGDELAEQVRAAFDAYVFLSYRKKDRQQAQILMKLVHQSPLCRDIAIWYDEFLVPGENFNDSIRSALENSDLFLMAVTPNLVCEENYIMTTEYPMAQKIGKPILAAEMVNTDTELLKANYEGITDSVDPTDEEKFTELLVSALHSRSLRKGEGNPRHDLFIGLAYLAGIDVEVDRERAFELITGAAKAGLPEAMEQLAKMYGNGEGAPIDYARQTEWLKKAVKCRRGAFRHSGMLADGIELINTELMLTRELVSDYNEPYDYKADLQGFLQAQRCCKSALYTAEALVKRHPGEEAERALLRCRTELGNLLLWYARYSNGKMQNAGRWYQLAEHTARQLAERTNDSRDWLTVGELIRKQIISSGPINELSRKLLELAEERLRAGDWETAALGILAGQNLLVMETDAEIGTAVGIRTLAIAEQLVQNRGLDEDLLEVCTICEQLGISLVAYGNIADGEKWLHRAINEMKTVPKTVSADIVASHVASSCIALGQLYMDSGRREEAADWFRRSLDVWQCGQREKKRHYKPVRVVHLSYALRMLARLSYEMGDSHESEQWYFKLIHRLIEEVNYTHSEKTAAEVVDLCVKLGQQKNDRDLIRQARLFNFELIKFTGGKKAYLKRDRELSGWLYGKPNTCRVLGIKYVFWSVRNLFTGRNSLREKKQYSIYSFPKFMI